MGRQTLKRQDLRGIQDRLRDFISWYHGDVRAEFGRKAEVQENTMTGWFQSPIQKMRAPDLANLLKVARGTGMSLDWLLMGRGEPIWTSSSGTGPERLRAVVAAELFASEVGTQLGEIERALPPPEEVLDWVMEAIRPSFREMLSLVREIRRGEREHLGILHAMRKSVAEMRKKITDGGAPRAIAAGAEKWLDEQDKRLDEWESRKVQEGVTPM
jgi:hypothetical protein